MSDKENRRVLKLALTLMTLLASPAMANSHIVLDWWHPSAQAHWSDLNSVARQAGDPLRVHVLTSQWVHLEIGHGWAMRGRDACPAKFIENGEVVSEFTVCSNSETYQLNGRFLHACGREIYLASGD